MDSYSPKDTTRETKTMLGGHVKSSLILASCFLVSFAGASVTAQEISGSLRVPVGVKIFNPGDDGFSGMRLLGAELGAEYFGLSVRLGASFDWAAVGIGAAYDLRIGVPILEHDILQIDDDLRGRIVPSLGLGLFRVNSESNEVEDEFPLDVSWSAIAGLRYEFKGVFFQHNDVAHGFVFDVGVNYHYAFVENALDNPVERPVSSFLDLGMSFGYLIKF